MANVFVEREKDGWVAIQNKKVILRGKTQKEVGDKAHERRPNDPILGERVENTSKGKPDKWRHLHSPKKK